MNRMMFCMALCGFFVATGCSTILNGSMDRVRIVSDPPGASVFVDGVEYGVTPLQQSFTSKLDHQVVIRKEGYRDLSFEMEQTVHVSFWFNILNFGVGFIIDLISEKHWEISPDEYRVKLVPLEGGNDQ